MEILVIGKPALNIYFPLQEAPSEGDIFTIRNQTESIGNVGAVSACLLAKWKMPVHVTGVTGNDGYAMKIRDKFQAYKKIDLKYTEVDYTHPTSLNYFILNSKTGVSSKIICNDPNVQLQKYKYDFIPDWAIIDGTDYAGAHALLNNNSTVQTVFYGRVGDKDSIAMSKRCTYVICTQVFAEMISHESCDGSADSCVNFYQKIVDFTGKNNYIVILNNHKILYADNGQVKMLPAAKFNIADYSSFESNFVGAFTFAMVLKNNINDALKFANIAAGLSLGKVGEENAIPELEDVIENSGLRSRLITNPNQAETILHGDGSNQAVINSEVNTVNESNVTPESVSMPQAEANTVSVSDNFVPQDTQSIESSFFGAAPVKTEVAQPVVNKVSITPVVEEPQVQIVNQQPVAPQATPVANFVAPSVEMMSQQPVMQQQSIQQAQMQSQVIPVQPVQPQNIPQQPVTPLATQVQVPSFMPQTSVQPVETNMFDK